ncbi:outer membrane protein OmpA-like peptidoglycan-associated protein [Brevundimonas alba]|uniref:Outer membrane protein OmpA-like peptidoglycan-associated protein n=1 Tax=Brevundimonas alba TaxID=74314 RepID=A0A7X5YKE2_9CAUL|nr:OmpA family protein [Brevundimonas alba]NJC40299.1 outer membrane protein OmpA-like peptidoglycan-associated protein [Brevundimonas alba]
MHAKLIVTGVSVIALLGACTTTDPYSSTPRRNNTGTGAIAGALGGALLGYLTNTSNSEEGRKNALIGAGIGALGGAAVGAYMDRQQRELEAELSGSGVGVARQGDNLVLRMPSDVTFASNQASISPRFNATLDDVAAVLNRYDQSVIDIIGHADSDGADDYNLNLSRQRASSVAQYLVNRNVLADRLYVDGRGESQPVATNATAEGKAQNRRVEIVIRPFRG